MTILERLQAEYDSLNRHIAEMRDRQDEIDLRMTELEQKANNG